MRWQRTRYVFGVALGVAVLVLAAKEVAAQPGGGEADVSVEIFNPPTQVQVGPVYSMLVVVRNAGPAPATNIQVTERLRGLELVQVRCGGPPIGTQACTIPVLPPNRAVGVSFLVRAVAGGGNAVDFRVSAESDTPDPVRRNNRADIRIPRAGAIDSPEEDYVAPPEVEAEIAEAMAALRAWLGEELVEWASPEEGPGGTDEAPGAPGEAGSGPLGSEPGAFASPARAAGGG